MVVAYDLNRGIGANGDLPWGRSLPADLANFKAITSGGSVVMGRKTFESIGSRPLPNRQNIVLSSRSVENATRAVSMKDAIAKATGDVFIIGGSRVFEDATTLAEIIYATEVHYSFTGADVFFPHLDSDWQEISRTHHDADDKNSYSFDFVKYQRVKRK